MNAPGYDGLARILNQAFDQSASGKGKERHAGKDQHFEDQPIATITDRYGPGFPMGQAEKKMDEAYKMFARQEFAKAKHEILGAIVYLAATALYMEDAQLGPVELPKTKAVDDGA